MIVHLPFLSDFIYPILEKTKHTTRRPLKLQPKEIVSGQLIFSGSNIWEEDYLCGYGKPGDLLLFHAEGNDYPFFEARMVKREIQRLLDIKEIECKAEGSESIEDFLTKWDLIYGETEFASIFNPYVWVFSWR